MSKLFQKFKRWISGLTTVVLVVSIITPGIAFAAIPDVSVVDKVTNDSTPSLEGSVDDVTATLVVTVSGSDYVATNNGDGTWTLADDTITALIDGVYGVSVIATNLDGPSVPAIGSLTIDTVAPNVAEVTPVVTPTNDQTPAYSFSSDEVGEIAYAGGCDSTDTAAIAGLNTIVFDSLSEGTYDSCSLDVTDLAGNLATLTVSPFEIDVTAPAVSGVVNGGHYNTDVTPEFTEGTAVLKYSGNVDPFVSGTVVSDEDVYVLEVTDVAGNTKTIVFTIDKTAPMITLNGNNPFTVERGTAYVEPGATTDTGEGVTSSGSVDTATIGDYTVTYDAVDAAGNNAVSVDRTVLVRDTVYPYVNAGTDKITNMPIFQDASADDDPFAITSYAWSQDSGIGTASFNPDAAREDVIFSADVDDVYTVRLTVTDAAGNTSWDVADITWDTTAPVVNAGGNVYANSAFLQDASVTDNLSGVATYAWGQVDGPGTVNFTNPNSEDTWVSADVDGTYLVRLTATDVAGNVGTGDFTLVWDTVDPVVSDLRVITDYSGQYVDGTGFEIRADVADDRSGINALSCQYTIDGTNWYSANFDGMNDECYMGGLTALDGTDLVINVRVMDRAGNLGVGAVINREVDEASPIFGAVNVQPSFGGYTSSDPTVTSSVSDSVTSVTECWYSLQENAEPWTVYTSTTLSGGQCRVSLVGLNDGSTYHILFRAQDEIGHLGYSVARGFTVDAVAPTVDAGPDVRTNQSMALDATASDFASGIAAYTWTQVSGPLGGLLVFSSPTTEDTDVTADKDGFYVARLTVVDNVGNVSSDEVTIEWDTQVNKVSGLQAVAGDKEVKLTWSNPTDKDLAAIKVYRSQKAGELGTMVATLAADIEGFVDLGLTNGTAYFYTVETIDDLGNSTKTAQVSATPAAPVVEEEELSEVESTNYGYYDNNIVSEGSNGVDEGQEVKSDETEKDEDKTESDTNVPVVGIIILILLIALGLYLLYLQNPEMFTRLAFWKKNKKE